MLITEYTDYDDVRAALGVSTDELEDTTLGLPLYANLLKADLEDIDLTLPATFTTVIGVGSPSDEQTRFLEMANVFATFSVAKELTSSLPLFAAKQVTDSKAGMTRFDNPYKDVVARVEKEYVRARNRLAQAFAVLNSSTTSTTTRPYMLAVVPASDPITGV